jgi:hypothetical protein
MTNHPTGRYSRIVIDQFGIEATIEDLAGNPLALDRPKQLDA